MLKLQTACRQSAKAGFSSFQVRRSSTIDFAQLENELKSRQLPVLYSYLTPQPSYLLNKTLRDFLASSSLAKPGRGTSLFDRYPLPSGHHLVYFPTSTTASQLLPDGTDTLHSPPSPFSQRLWAGGQVSFKAPVYLNAKIARLVECISDVRVTGTAGSEKVFVGIERRIGRYIPSEKEDVMRDRVLAASEDDPQVLLVERRDLCFLRDDTPVLSQSSKPPKALAPPADPSYTFTLTPTQALLFRFSALTFNAHAIHIDPEYTRKVYGLPKLLVHGPLCLVLMLECLERALLHERQELNRDMRIIKEISYRNFKPLFVGEEMRICGKKRPHKEGKNGSSDREEWEVWIETGEGDEKSLAVRGTVTTSEAHRGPTYPEVKTRIRFQKS